MTHQEFVYPSDQELIEMLGVGSRQYDLEPTIRELSISNEDGSITLIYDTVGRSIEVRWLERGRKIVNICREGAVLLRLFSDSDGIRCMATFQADVFVSTIEIAVTPTVKIEDSLLLR